MFSLKDVAKELLNNNCSNPRDNGFNAYDIELCCMNYRIIAKPPEEFGSDDWQIEDIQMLKDDGSKYGTYVSINGVENTYQ